MTKSLCHRLILLAAACLVAVASVVSAARMAPATADSADLAAYLAVAGTLDDLCGDPSSHPDHPCPFCRLLSDPPAIAFAPREDRLVPYLGLSRLADLIPGSQSGNPHVSARAPPARA